MKRLLLLLTCGWLTLALSAQDVGDWRESLRQWMTAEEIEDVELEDPETGEHYFSKRFSEHNNARVLYLKKR